MENSEQPESLKNMSDEEILRLSVSRPENFTELVNRYQEPFLRKVRSILGDREEVSDCVQDAFTKIYVNAGRFRVQEGARFSSWAYKIVINTALTYYNKLKREHGATVAIEYEQLERLGTDNYLESQHPMEDYVVSVISRLPRHLSRALSLYFFDGYSQKEIAQMEGISLGAVKTRIHRAKREFRRSMTSVES